MKLLTMQIDTTMTVVRGVAGIFFVEEEWMKDRVKRIKGRFTPALESTLHTNEKNDDHANN